MKLLSVCVLLSFVLFEVTQCYRILGIFPMPSTSHFVMFERLMQGLAEKGHEVDVVSHFPQSKPFPRYNDLSIRGTIPIFVNNISFSFLKENFVSRYDLIKFITIDAGQNLCDVILNSKVAADLKETKKKYDILITEVFGTDCMLGFAHHFNIPAIVMTSSVNLPWGGDRFGNPDNPSYIPSYLSPYLSKMTLWERLDNTVTLLIAKVWYYVTQDITTKVVRDFFGPNFPNLNELAHKTNLILVNSHFSSDFARPTVPNFVEVGGLHIKPQKPLPKHLEEAVNITSTKYKGIIYLSFGSMVLTETLPTETLKAFFGAFGELPYKVLWKANKEKMPKHLDIPSNIHFEPWMPQADILCHPNVKMFVTHGGLMGTQEAIHCGVPRLGIPLFADQELNLRASEAMGLAIQLNYKDATKKSIFEISKRLLNDPKYAETAKTVAERFRDRPLSPLETAIYWVEYVIRQNGAPHLRTVGTDLPWYQYYLVDVAAILGTILMAILASLYYVILYLRKLCFGVKEKKD